ncbi:MAG: putative Ig domain-containing protein, partial [Desulfofustis sp.]|nr:putative Ig domain-containing protein [Desulfofustis sp.]
MKITNIRVYVGLIILWCSIFAAITANAVTLSLDKTTILQGESVTATTRVVFIGAGTPPAGSFRIDFGDGTAPTRFNDLTSTSHTFTVSHEYLAPGTYTIRATAQPALGFSAAPPLEASQTITVLEPVDDQLPRGEVGEQYRFILTSVTGLNTYRYRLVQGRLPSGIELDSQGRFSGIPQEKGNFRFKLRITTPSGFTFMQDFVLIVDPGRLLIETAPGLLNLTVGGGAPQRVTFTVVQPTVPLPEIIRSTRGEFVLAGRVIGTYNALLTVNLNTSRPSISESVTVPQSVLQAAQNAGNNRIMYRRTFSAQNLRSGIGETRVNLRTAAAGELRITGMRVFFEQNNRPMILVERNERNLTGVAEIRYNGSGPFQGYWKVDERIIQRVQQNLFYGTVLTLKTPTAPPLPTYSEGAHRLQFIITEPAVPAQRIDFPEAIYHVEAKKAAIVVPITVTAPEDRAVLSMNSALFSWHDNARIQTYQLDFYQEDETEPFFSAYTKSGQYQLTNRIIELKFAPASAYRWQVRGFNGAGELAAESRVLSFTLAPEVAYVPGQVIFLVDDSTDGRDLIDAITARYPLLIVERTNLASIKRIMVTCSTDGDVALLVEQLRHEDGLRLAQPNFIYQTMNEPDPLRSMQSIHRLVDLTPIQHQTGGELVRVAIIDTGVDLEHQDFAGRIRSSHNMTTSSPYRGELHGTAVAGIIAAARNE